VLDGPTEQFVASLVYHEGLLFLTGGFPDKHELSEFSALYRALCFDLSLVQSRDWGGSIHRYLNNLAGRGHNCFYRSRPGSLRAILLFLSEEFPQLLRANLRYFVLALILFVLPGLVSGLLVCQDSSRAGRIVPSSHQAMFESMYSKSIGERDSQDMQAIMAGFYVYNNVGIAFKCFALGSFAGIGTMVVLVYNSIFLGTVAGFLVARGHSQHFFEFVIGHGSFELTAIVVSGMAGLILGHALVHPGALSLADSLRQRGLVAVKLALGAGFMLGVAALIEAFWSPAPIPRDIKYAVGTLLWLVVAGYLSLAGRRSHPRSLHAD